jgi:hypothetical protein
MNATAILSPTDELERATSDYLAVSRNAHLYGTTSDYELAETRAWDRVMAAREALGAIDSP